MKFISEYSLKENLRRKCYFIICLITCFLVSLVALVAKSVVSQGSLIFLMLGEKDSGEIDFYMMPTPLTRNTSYFNLDDYHKDNAFINFTKYGELLSSEKLEKEANPYDTSTIRTYLNGFGTSKALYLMLIDTEKEREIELGRDYPYGKLSEGECLVHKNLINNNQNEFSMTIPLNNFITDTYPDKHRMAKLYKVDIKSNEAKVIADTYSPKTFQSNAVQGHIACDLHPTVSASGKYVCFDCPRTGKRGLYIMEIPQ